MWSDWGPYSSCSVSCGDGNKQRSRTCLNGIIGQDCIGNDSQTVSCNEQDCSSWTKWTEYGKCSVTCGTGSQSRSRQCENGDDCVGANIETKSCNLSPCSDENDKTNDISENDSDEENKNENTNNDTNESKIGKVAGCNASDGSIQLEAHINKDDVQNHPDGFVLDGDVYKATFDPSSLTPSRDGDNLVLTKTVKATGKQVDVEGTIVKTHVSETITFICTYGIVFNSSLILAHFNCHLLKALKTWSTSTRRQLSSFW